MSYHKISISTRIFGRRPSILAWVNRRPVLVAKVGDLFYAMDAVCAHMGCAVLTEANGVQVTCPAHEAVWDIRTGALVAEPKIKPEMPCEQETLPVPLRTYQVRERDGFLEVDL